MIMKSVPYTLNRQKTCISISGNWIIQAHCSTLISWPQMKMIFYLIDQHAAHERVFYEKLLNQYNSAEKSSQQRCYPINIGVSVNVTASEETWIDDLRAMGYDIEFFGNNTYIVREIPAFMDISEAEAFLSDFFQCSGRQTGSDRQEDAGEDNHEVVQKCRQRRGRIVFPGDRQSHERSLIVRQSFFLSSWKANIHKDDEIRDRKNVQKSIKR